MSFSARFSLWSRRAKSSSTDLASPFHGNRRFRSTAYSVRLESPAFCAGNLGCAASFPLSSLSCSTGLRSSHSLTDFWRCYHVRALASHWSHRMLLGWSWQITFHFHPDDCLAWHCLSSTWLRNTRKLNHFELLIEKALYLRSSSNCMTLELGAPVFKTSGSLRPSILLISLLIYISSSVRCLSSDIQNLSNNHLWEQFRNIIIVLNSQFCLNSANNLFQSILFDLRFRMN